MSGIWVLDDSRTNRAILSRLAASIEPDVAVEAFEDAPSALAALGSPVPDLVVTDFNMPRMDGAEFVAAFRCRDGCAEVPVMVVTAHEDREYRYRALEAGATDFLNSPVDHREFIVRARNLLTMRRNLIAREKAEAASAAKTAFLANMSHDLRTPLNAIAGFAEVMQNEMLGPIGTPRYLEYIRDIRNSAQHLTGIIQNILDISLIEQGRLQVEAGRQDMGDILGEAVRTLSPVASEKGIDLETDIPDSLPPVRGDRSKLTQVFLNLLSNAVKFTPDGGRVGIEARAAAGRVVVAVRDTGIGMTRAQAAEAVRPFIQISNNPFSKKYQGTGLGLSIADSLVRMMDGDLMIDSVPGEGTRVTVQLPADLPEAGLDMQAAGDADIVGGRASIGAGKTAESTEAAG